MSRTRAKSRRQLIWRGVTPSDVALLARWAFPRAALFLAAIYVFAMLLHALAGEG